MPLRPPLRGRASPHLVLRFAVSTAVALALAAGAVFWFVRQQAVDRAERSAVFHTQFIADAVLSHRLRPSDFARPVGAARRRQLDLQFRALRAPGSLRVKLWRPDGLVAYSDDHSLIGTRLKDEVPLLRRAIDGHPQREVTRLNGEGGKGADVKVIEVYVPVRVGAGHAPGVFELYQDYAPIAADARSGMTPLAGVLALTLLGLWIALFPLLRQSMATLESRNRRLADQADRLRSTLTEREQAERARRHSEEQLRHAQKMEAVGRLAGGIAHDFNNLLLVINGYSELALTRMNGDDPATRRSLEQILAAGGRAAALTRQLLAFSRKQVLQPELLDLNEVVGELEPMLRRLIGEDVELTVTFAGELGLVEIDRGQLEQILLNLAVNARDALPHGGELVIETGGVDGSPEAAELGHDPARYTVLSVRDTGVGMDEETLNRIFEPFFTTKEAGKGTGLGLSTVYGIVDQSGGRITVTSAPGEGTVFTIYLPVAAEAASRPARAESVGGGGGSERVLLVEDEDEVRSLVTEMLERSGYAVVAAADPGEALRLARAAEPPFDLMITDVVMPGMSGRRLAEELAEDQPELRVIYTSGYSGDAIAERGVAAFGTAFLQKPFGAGTLARKVREILDAA